ncbi:hypothetical protein [Anaerocolumna xylanovorans]|uniref:Uncharacterized protein n=1 Tax=Anaerocolumna xylanovorans DSM 12503 TaxID=1121345 RepID=A0A1M7YFY3_9FIRM|nr:hypothetical protein [Anaerocolumna xylanovorans]SHO51554.1 hypothetical protein SAMN02745217_03253 [Anaerocolumna xylanovorans DSM 12503]
MPYAEFGIIDCIDKEKDYSEYEPDKYKCITINDDIYINDWWDKLAYIKTYFHNLNRPSTALARWGITIIPPESLPAFQDIVISDKRINDDESLVLLADMIQLAIDNDKYMIHFGV